MSVKEVTQKERLKRGDLPSAFILTLKLPTARQKAFFAYGLKPFMSIKAPTSSANFQKFGFANWTMVLIRRSPKSTLVV